MPKIMLINVTHSEESRVAIINNNLLESFEIESFAREHLKSNLYNAVVRRIHPALEAAFVDIGGDRDAFLPLDEICFLNLPQPLSGGLHGNEENGRRRRRIRDVLRPGQEILVQIAKEQFANKPPTLTTFYSLPGRYLVLLPGSEDIGISRRIEGEDRTRLRGLVERLDIPSGCGLIVRTAAGVDDESAALSTDLAYLQRLWKSIQETAASKQAPALVYREHDIVLRTIRDFFTPDIDEIHIDNEEVFQRAREFLHSVLPGKEHVLRLYERDQPIFSAFDVESQIDSIFKRRVQLPSGGSIVIDGTEALTAIDVNSGGSMRGANPEETAFRTNREAATEIGRQLRLRDIGGLLVIDFIDMRDRAHIHEIEHTLRDAMQPDKARHELGPISSFGLMEVSRQRLRPAATANTYTACSMCDGHGAVRTTESAALVALRKIHNRVAKGDVAEINVSLPPLVAMYLLNQKRDELARLELHYNTRLQMILDEKLMPHQAEMSIHARSTRDIPADVVAPGTVAAADKPTAPRREARTKGASPPAQRGRSGRQPRQPKSQQTATPGAGTATKRASSQSPAEAAERPAGSPEATTGRKRRRRRGRRKSPSLRAAIAIGEALAAIGTNAGLHLASAEKPPASTTAAASAPQPSAGQADRPAADKAAPPKGRSRRRGGRRTASRSRPRSTATATPNNAPATSAGVSGRPEESPAASAPDTPKAPRKKSARRPGGASKARTPATRRATVKVPKGEATPAPTATTTAVSEAAAKTGPHSSVKQRAAKSPTPRSRSAAKPAGSVRSTKPATAKKAAAKKKASPKRKAASKKTGVRAKTVKPAAMKTKEGGAETRRATQESNRTDAADS